MVKKMQDGGCSLSVPWNPDLVTEPWAVRYSLCLKPVFQHTCLGVTLLLPPAPDPVPEWSQPTSIALLMELHVLPQVPEQVVMGCSWGRCPGAQSCTLRMILLFHHCANLSFLTALTRFQDRFPEFSSPDPSEKRPPVWSWGSRALLRFSLWATRLSGLPRVQEWTPHPLVGQLVTTSTRTQPCAPSSSQTLLHVLDQSWCNAAQDTEMHVGANLWGHQTGHRTKIQL